MTMIATLVFEEALESYARTVEQAEPDKRLAVFQNVIREPIGWVAKGLVEKIDLVDRLRSVALDAGLIGEVGEDAVQKAIADAIFEPDPVNGHGPPNLGNGFAFDDPTSNPAPIRFPLVAFDQVSMSHHRRHLVKNLLPIVGLAVVYGPPKCGKSYVVFDMMMHVALEWEYRGRRVQQGAVVYLALEGGEGFKARIEAFRRRRLDGKSGVPFHLVSVPTDLVADHRELIANIGAQHVAPAVVVIDTLNRSLVGSESSDQDMARYIRAADAIREAFNCLVVIIHHSGLEKGRPRGHTSLTGAADVQMKVERDAAGNIIMSLEWMKDGAEGGEPIVSKLEVVEVGTDEDGENITACVVEPVEGVTAPRAAAKEPRLTKGAKTALKALHKAMTDAGTKAPASNHIPAGVKVVTKAQWREYAYRQGISDGEDRAKQLAFKRAFEHLVSTETVGVWDEHVWLAR